MSYILFLDDERIPGFSVRDYNDSVSIVVIARNVDDALTSLHINGVPHTIHFDHDLGHGDNGFDFAKDFANFIMNGKGNLPENFQFFVHSQNPIGAKNIREFMNNFLKIQKG